MSNEDKKKRWIRSGKLAVECLLAVLLIFQLSILVIGKVKGEETLAKLPISILQIESDSMYPRLRAGDGVLSVKTRYDKLKVGQIITYYNSGSLVTHEIVRKEEDGTVVTQGSMNDFEDGPISESIYVSRMLIKIPGLQKILGIMGDAKGQLTVILFVLILCFGDIALSRIYDRVEKMKERK